MDLQLGTSVATKDGADAGTINKVIFNPDSGETEAIVIRKGKLLGREVAVPTELIRVAAPSRVELDLVEAELESRPPFVSGDYHVPPSSWTPPYDWPLSGVLWSGPVGSSGSMRLTGPDLDDAQPRPYENAEAVVSEGTEVVARDGEKVGSVANVVLDVESNRPSRLVIRRGLLFTQDVEIPGDWVDSVDTDRVALNVDKVTIEELAKHQS